MALDSYASGKDLRNELSEKDQLLQDERTRIEEQMSFMSNSLDRGDETSDSTKNDSNSSKNARDSTLAENSTPLSSFSNSTKRSQSLAEMKLENTQLAALVEQQRQAQSCSQESWENSTGIQFNGCQSPLSSDQQLYEWKLWEDALRDGDICVKDLPDGSQQAYMKEDC